MSTLPKGKTMFLAAVFAFFLLIYFVGEVKQQFYGISNRNTANSFDAGDPLYAGLVAYWKFDGEDGLNIKDYSANKNDFKVARNGFVEGIDGKAMDLNASSGFIPHSPSLNLTNEATISFWLYPRSLPARYTTIINKSEAGKPLQTTNYAIYMWGLETAPENRGINFWGGTDRSTWGAISPRSSLRLETWQHVVLVYKNGVGGKLYMNGQQVGGIEDKYKGMLSTNEGTIRIGGTGADVLVDDLMIFNRALSDSEVASLAYSNKEMFISVVPDKTETAGNIVTFNVVANCSTTCSGVEYSIEGAPTGATIDSGTGRFEWTPAGNQVGDFKVNLKAKSGSLEATSYVNIRITPLVTTELNDCKNGSDRKCIDFGSDNESESGGTFAQASMSEKGVDGSVNFRSILPKKNAKISVPSFSTNAVGGISAPLFLEIRYKDNVSVEDGRKDPIKVNSYVGIASDNAIVRRRDFYYVAALGDSGDGNWKTSSYLFQYSPTPLIRDVNGMFNFEIYNPSPTKSVSIDFISLKTIPKGQADSFLEEKRTANGHIKISIPEKLAGSQSLAGKNLVAFYRDYMRPIFDTTKPADSEINGTIKGLGFSGELETLNFGLYSSTGVNGLTVEVSDLTNGSGDVIRPESKFFEIIYGHKRLGLSTRKEYAYIPDYLQPFSILSLDGNKSKRVVFRVPIPSNAKGGMYGGLATIKSGGNILASLPISLKVVPVKLTLPETNHVMYHDPYLTTYAMRFSEATKIYSDAYIEPWMGLYPEDIKLADKATAKYDVSRFATKIDQLLASGVIRKETPMLQVHFYPWDKMYVDMIGTINGVAVGSSGAKYIYYDTPDLYDRLSHPDYVRAFKSVMSSLEEVARSED
jgi:hypothetical protein